MKILIRTVSNRGKVRDYETYSTEAEAKKAAVKLKKWFLGKGWIANLEHPYVLVNVSSKSTIAMYLVDLEGVDDLTGPT
jgi:hypothetical protein